MKEEHINELLKMSDKQELNLAELSSLYTTVHKAYLTIHTEKRTKLTTKDINNYADEALNYVQQAYNPNKKSRKTMEDVVAKVNKQLGNFSTILITDYFNIAYNKRHEGEKEKAVSTDAYDTQKADTYERWAARWFDVNKEE